MIQLCNSPTPLLSDKNPSPLFLLGDRESKTVGILLLLLTVLSKVFLTVRTPIFLSQLNPFQTFSGILPRRGLRSLVNPSIFASDMQSGEINLPSYGGEGGGGGEGGQIADLAPLSWMHHGKLSFC